MTTPTMSTPDPATTPAGQPAAPSALLQPLIVDVAAMDGVGPTEIARLVAAGYPWAGLAMQCSHGLRQVGHWFDAAWHASSRGVVAGRYAQDWFRIAYHYLVVSESPEQQADLALSAVDVAGGWDDGDLWLGADVERAEQPPGASRSLVEDTVARFAERVLGRTGRRPLLYAGSYTRDLGIASRMGCCLLWYPQWSPSIDWSTVRRMGWDIDTTMLWQVTGNAPASVPGYPATTPIGLQDFNVMVRANLPAAEALAWTRTHTGSRPA
jgi:hypothetical protein